MHMCGAYTDGNSNVRLGWKIFMSEKSDEILFLQKQPTPPSSW